MTPVTSKLILAETVIRYLDSDHGLFLIAMAIIGFVLLALNGGVMR